MPRANRNLHFWQDLELTCAVDLAMDMFCDVFQFSRRSSLYEFDQLVPRIRQKHFSPDEIERGTPVSPAEPAELRRRKQSIPQTDDDFFHDVIERAQLPRAWD